MAEKTVKLYFDGELQEATVKQLPNGDFECALESGRFIRFPGTEDLADSVKAHNAAHKDLEYQSE